MGERFGVIVIGGGPAGIAAALTLAKGGASDVLVIERGRHAGSKNVFGGILYGQPLTQLFPEFPPRGCPVERRVVRRAVSFAGPEDAFHLGFSTAGTLGPCYTAHRSRFDKWFGEQAEAAGVTILADTVAERLLRDGAGRVTGVGVRTTQGEQPEEGELTADLVIDAEGVNPKLAVEAGLVPPLPPQQLALGVKEVRSLPAEVIEDRFHLGADEGLGWEWYGRVTAGLWGSGFIYTNKDSISVGTVVSLADLAKGGLRPHDILKGFTAHPAVQPLVRGSSLLEYSAHLLPETPWGALPAPVGDGVLLVGDAAGLVNLSPWHEGINLAVSSGIAAAQTYLGAPDRKALSREVLSGYLDRLAEGTAGRDMADLAALGRTLQSSPEMTRAWPDGFTAALKELLTVDGRTKREAAAKSWAAFNSIVGAVPFGFTLWRFAKSLAPAGDVLVARGMELANRLGGMR